MKPLLIRSAWRIFSNLFPAAALELDYLRHNKYFERDLWLVPRFCSIEKISLDIGANTGIFSRLMAKHSSRVESFECNPFLYSKLRKTLPANATLHPFALSSINSSTILRVDPKNTGIGTIECKNILDQNPGISSIDTLTVNTRTLDSFDFRNISFMKIDVEGHELEVLKGAVTLLQTQHPVLLIEIEERHCPGNLQSVPAFLSAYGYSPFLINDASTDLVPCPSLSSSSLKGVNNFWFISPR